MLVSVIIPTYKRSDYLLQTIESVLSQTYPSIEIIIVDDNGLGNKFQVETQKKLQKYIVERKIIYIPHEVNKNGAAARNTGFRASKGEYINFLESVGINYYEEFNNIFELNNTINKEIKILKKIIIYNVRTKRMREII